jgi:hypothetical protein
VDVGGFRLCFSLPFLLLDDLLGMLEGELEGRVTRYFQICLGRIVWRMVR